MAGLPSRIAEIRRDLSAIVSALGGVGGGGSPNELRSDAGVMVTVGVDETLKRHVDLMDQDVELIALASPGADTTVSATFSFAEDTYIQGLMFRGSITPANFVFGTVVLRPQNQTARMMICHTLLADRVTFVGLTEADDIFLPQYDVPFPLFVKQDTDIIYQVRSGAGGGVTTDLSVYRTSAPKGVEIPH